MLLESDIFRVVQTVVEMFGCMSNPCQNNASCMDIIIEGFKIYNCECIGGYTGEHCQTGQHDSYISFLNRTVLLASTLGKPHCQEMIVRLLTFECT